ncbi:MAG: 50S ribosomal protein L4, partial [Mariprofundaceae bacterium]
GSRELSPAVFGLDPDSGLVHRVLVALQAGLRAGTHSTKTRSTVSGGGKKPFKQKGTGRARQGTTRATQMRHGAVAHGPLPRSYSTRINKRERRRALCLALSGHAQKGSLIVVDAFTMKAIKTRDFIQSMTALNADHALIVLHETNAELQLSSRNVRSSKVVLDGQLNLHDLLKCKCLILTDAVVDKLEGRLS